MVVQFTIKHYDFLNHVFKVMKSFYNNNYTDICFEIGKTYGAPEEDIKRQSAFSIRCLLQHPFLQW